ncbi:DASH family cryptochrome [Halobaculum gomorrense]|uniref:Cryptochrome DASH n=1 Tax=Halobaculum gomorrense TaxID=43928 RepID=A0A1M5U340_9EURY|nr:DASH family cryptochrome [Halobaculum gomorrense]SHH57276.1 deoxyribodipyrimidine photo-lyase (single-stranded DNA-specific) [Halobaculum gomorrense]
MTHSTAVVWFRRDLRVHDNEALTEAAVADEVLPVYAFAPDDYDEREYGGRGSFRFQKTGPHRTRFRLESVADLRERLRERGSDLVVRHDRPERVVPAVASAVDADSVHFHTVPAPEETAVENAVKRELAALDVAARRHWGHTLHHINDLPMAYTEVPDTYTTFRKRVEADSTVRDTLGTPALPAGPVDAVGAGELPDPETLGVEARRPDERGVLTFEGGEAAGLDRLERYVWEADRLREYKETRNGLLGEGYSSKLSAWLNEGCLSPRRVAAEVDRYEDLRVSNDSTYWLLFELRWRDFFQFQVPKHGGQYFAREGIREREDIDWRDDESAFERWAAGETGVPFVDANMQELNATGYMSNRGRQNAASFLANDLRVDWRRGAAYFETQLVDYDAASNYGNWAYIAGVGNDSRDRSFDVVSQARRYDSEGEYVTHWLPELGDLPADRVHEPWTLSDQEQAEHGVELGVDYPEPMVRL